jgi:hypothetical protein
LNGIDFRFLELYLDGATYAEAARRYQDIVITPQQIEAGIIDRVESYRSRFNQGLEAFDYAPFYEESVRKDLRSFSLFNHPDNAQLSWLGSQILKAFHPADEFVRQV